jgi:hypothetical protein
MPKPNGDHVSLLKKRSERLVYGLPMNRTDSFFRWLFYFLALSSGAIFWLAKHLPMADLPQHAGQVALAHDLILHHSPWHDEVRLNLFTPYLLGYGVATALSFAMPVEVALKIELTLAYYGYIAALIFMRRRLGGDARLDWFFLIGWFGFSYQYGFFTFIVSAPLAVLYIYYAQVYARNVSVRRGWALFLFGFALFFCHGLIFLFSNFIGFIFLILHGRLNFLRIAKASWPYLMLGFLCIIYYLAHKNVDMHSMYPYSVIWWMTWARLLAIFFFPWGISPQPLIALGFSGLMLMAASLLGVRFNSNKDVFVPIAVVSLVILVVPHFAMNIAFLSQRFAIFAFPFMAMTLTNKNKEIRGVKGASLQVIGQFVMALVCAVFIGMQARYTMAFNLESKDYDSVAQGLIPGQRALSLVWDRGSSAAGNSEAYRHFPVWYQAEQQGFVDYNFAWSLPQLIRFKMNHLPAMGPTQVLRKGTPIDLGSLQVWRYKYIFVRRRNSLSSSELGEFRCNLKLIQSRGLWSVYENFGCK